MYVDAILAFGVSLDADQEIPWQSARSAISWWLDVNDYEPPLDITDEQGYWLPGNERKVDYFSPRRAFLREHPLPVEIVMYGSDENPMYIIAAPGTVLTAYGSKAESIILPEPSMEMTQAVIDFCVNFELKGDGPAWWLTSLYMR